MIAVISPAKRLDESAPPANLSFTKPDLLHESEKLVKVARKLGPDQLSELMSISEDLAELNHRRFQEWEAPFSLDNAKQAALLFAGDTYIGLDAPSLREEDLEWAQDHLRILSGLYGLVRPLDLIQPYRLEMGTSLKNRRGKNLYEFWGNRITKTINADLDDHEHKFLINLASKEYFSSIQKKGLKASVIEPQFKELRNGKPRVISFFAKKARGQMARFIIENRITEPEGLKAFSLDGYSFDEEGSTKSKWLFLREPQS